MHRNRPTVDLLIPEDGLAGEQPYSIAFTSSLISRGLKITREQECPSRDGGCDAVPPLLS